LLHHVVQVAGQFADFVTRLVTGTDAEITFAPGFGCARQVDEPLAESAGGKPAKDRTNETVEKPYFQVERKSAGGSIA